MVRIPDLRRILVIQLGDWGLHYFRRPLRKSFINPHLLRYSHPGGTTLITGIFSSFSSFVRETVHSYVVFPSVHVRSSSRSGPRSLGTTT